MKSKSACEAILEGYRSALVAKGDPFVLEERHPELRALATSAERDPIPFWKKLTKLLASEPAEPHPVAKATLLRDLPCVDLKPEFRRRLRVGMGSLGKPRFLALVEWDGGWVAREAKLVTPPATAWTLKRSIPSRMAEIVEKARRCPDPFYRPGAEWIVRRLAPHCSRIELDHLSRVGDVNQLLHAMGAETANVHLGTESAREPILKDLAAQRSGWLAEAAKTMAGVMSAEWTEWRSSRLPRPTGL